MSKTIIGVILIIVTLISFMGGVIFQYNDVEEIRKQQQAEYFELLDKYNELHDKYTLVFKQPVDFAFVHMWLDFAAYYHQYQIENRIFTEDKPLEYHQDRVALYVLLKQQIQIFEGKQVD